MTVSGASYAEERERMVAKQLMARGISDERVLEAMRTVPRHAFVPIDLVEHAYDDKPLNIGGGQTISQPYMVALMTELLSLRPTDRVLEVGTGSGYHAAVLAFLAAEVVTVERRPVLAEQARERLAELGYANIVVYVSDGTLGWEPAAPYDAILVTAGAPAVPEPLCRQLELGGRLVCPVGTRETQRLVVARCTEEGIAQSESIPCIFVPLIGQEGWNS